MHRKARTVVWDGGTEDFICRDERCTLLDVHLAHDIDDSPEVLAARQSLWGWMLDPFELSPARRGRAKPDPTYRIITKPERVRVLDEIILDTISQWTVKPFRVVHDDVTANYGSIDHRRLHRRLAALRKEQQVVYLAFNRGAIAGYTKPGSPLLTDMLHVQEILWHQQVEFGEREAA